MALFLAPWELWSLLNSCPFYPILQVWGSAQWLFYGNDSLSVASGVQPALPQFSKICLCHCVGMSVLSSQENGSYWWKTKKHRPDRPLSLYFFTFCCCHFWIFGGRGHISEPILDLVVNVLLWGYSLWWTRDPAGLRTDPGLPYTNQYLELPPKPHLVLHLLLLFPGRKHGRVRLIDPVLHMLILFSY